MVSRVIYATPKLTKEIRSRLAELDALRAQLGDRTGVASPWLGQIRRQAQASTARSSVLIEGYVVSERESLEIVGGHSAPSEGDDDRSALAAYAHAMDHVGAMAEDPSFRWLDRVILDLHFDCCSFQRDKRPGRWRTGGVQVTAAGDGPPLYVGPDADAVPGLMVEVAEWLEHGDLDAHVVVRAAMAHLHVVTVHPFADGNGRTSRIVQSLVLARAGVLAPELGSIEEYLQAHTSAYYDALARTQGGRYQPSRSARDWVAFCVEAHLDQARSRLALITDAGARWSRLEELVEERGWPDRLVIALEQSLFEGTDRQRYHREAGVAEVTATGDLRRLLDAGLVRQEGQTRNIRYLATDALRRVAAAT